MANIWVYTGGFRNVVCSCKNGVATCEAAHVCVQVVSQLRNTLWNFASGFHFAAHFTAAKFSHSLMQLSSNGHNFFISTLIGTPFKALDSWLIELRTTYSMHEMDSRKYSKYVQQLLSSWILHVRFLCFSSLHSWLALAKNYEAPKLGFFM